MDRFYFIRKGILGIHARARSGRAAVLRKIFLVPFGRSVFSAKILSRANPEPFKLPKQIPSIPAPPRHKHLNASSPILCPMGQFQYEITEILHPSTRHKWSRNIVCRHAGIHACCCTSIQLFIRSTNHTVIRLIGHTHMQSSVCSPTQSIIHLYSQAVD